MSSRRVVVCAAVVLVAALGLAGGSGAQAQPGPSEERVALVVLPEADAAGVFATRPFVVGLGVFPTSRDPARFVREIGSAAPVREEDAGDRPPGLARALRAARVQVLAGGALEGDPEIVEALAAAFEPGFRAPFGAGRRLDVYSLSGAATMDLVLGAADGPVIVVGAGSRTPVRVGICEGECLRTGASGRPRGVLTGSITRRPGVVTPYDVGATVLDRLGVPLPEGSVGEPLGGERDERAAARVDALATRLERDDSYAPGLAAVTVTLGILCLLIGLVSRRFGRREWAMRSAQAGVFVLPGWIVAVFVPSGRWEARSAVVLAAAVLGAALKPREPVRAMARLGLGAAVGFAILAVIAPLNAGGEPGLSIWGNPLVSWRFFGLQNGEAATIASGVVVWGVLAGLSSPVLGTLSLAVALVIGAPAVGANFVGVLTFAFGAAAAIFALARRRAGLRHLVAAGAIAVGAFALALAADAGSPVSHGGRAARTISEGGWTAAWDLVVGRLRLNAELVGDFTGGFLWVAGLAITLVALIAWGLRVERGPLRGRVAVLAGALMAAASLVLEDSGFYSGAILWFVAADAWLLVGLAPGKPQSAWDARSDRRRRMT